MPARLRAGAGIAADRYLRVRLAPATMTASSTTLGCHGNYGNPRTHGGLLDSNTSRRASAIGPRMPKPSKPRCSHSSSTSLRVLNKRPFHCLPSGVATRGIGIAPTSGLQWREIAEMTNASITTVISRLHRGRAATTRPGSSSRCQRIRHTGAETVA